MGNWSTCSRTCGGGTQSRPVRCTQRARYREESISASLCPQPAPPIHQACNSQSCPPAWSTGPWAEVTTWAEKGQWLAHTSRSAFAESFPHLLSLCSALGPVGRGGGRGRWSARAPTPQLEPSCCMTLLALQNPSLGPTKSACSNAATSTRSCSGWYLPGPRYAHRIPLEWDQP